MSFPPDPANPPADLDVVITNFATPTLLRRCLDSWVAHNPGAHGVRVNLIVVEIDGPVAPDTLPPDASLPDGMAITYLRLPWNAGYSGACNRAAVLGNAPIISFWNADTSLIDDDAIPTMMRFFAEHGEDSEYPAHVAGPLQTDEHGRITHAGIFGTHAAPKHRAWHEPLADSPDVRDVRPAITIAGSAYFIRRSTWDMLTRCPLYQERIEPGAIGAFLSTPHFFEETTCSYHAYAHRQHVWYVGTAHVEHLWDRAPKENGAATGRLLFEMSQPLFRRFCDIHGLEHD